MGGKKKKDKIIKKVKKRNTVANPILEKKMGAPKSEERDLTTNQKELGKLLGLGMNQKEIQERLQYSDYQIREYKKLSKVKERIKYYRDLKNLDKESRYKELWGDIETVALLELKNRIIGKTESKLSEKILMTIVNRTFVNMDDKPKKEENISKSIKTEKEKPEKEDVKEDSLFEEG